MNGAVVLRALALMLLVLAGLLAFLNFEGFQDGSISPLRYGFSFGGPLLMSIAIQIIARGITAKAGSDDNA